MKFTPVQVFMIRLPLALGAGWLLKYFFFGRSAWWVALILAALVLGSAYISEMWRKKNQD